MLTLDETNIAVKCFAPRHPYGIPCVMYNYRFMVPDNATYEVSLVQFSHERLANIKWNNNDFCVLAKGRDEQFTLVSVSVSFTPSPCKCRFVMLSAMVLFFVFFFLYYRFFGLLRFSRWNTGRDSITCCRRIKPPSRKSPTRQGMIQLWLYFPPFLHQICARLLTIISDQYLLFIRIDSWPICYWITFMKLTLRLPGNPHHFQYTIFSQLCLLSISSIYIFGFFVHFLGSSFIFRVFH